jgi:8-oxo-dGTP diphosphatase
METPRIISAVIPMKDDRVMLVKEVLEDDKEHWIFPGGGVDFGETLEEAGIREIKEELDLDVKIKEFLGFKEIIRTQFNYHTVIFFFIAEPLDDNVTKIEKVLDARYFTLSEALGLSIVDSARWAIEEIVKKEY